MQEKACGEWRRRMIAAEILRVTDRKRKIVLEDESSFVLYAGELRKYHIREGEEIPEEVLFRKKFWKRSMTMCSSKGQSSGA